MTVYAVKDHMKMIPHRPFALAFIEPQNMFRSVNEPCSVRRQRRIILRENLKPVKRDVHEAKPYHQDAAHSDADCEME